jgi:DUF4097 and DUF4098 domain-containing protein YvlB
MSTTGRGKIAVLAVVLLAFTAAPAWAGSGETKSFKMKPGRTAIFDLESGGSVTIIGWDKSEVEVTYYETGRGHDHVIEISELDGDVFIGSEMEMRSGRSKSLEFELRVPHEFNVEFESMGGSLEIQEVEGKFSGSTMGGAIVLKKVTGVARLTTMGGEIEVVGCDIDGFLKTMGGEVLLEDVVGDLDASSMGGDVRYVNVRDRDGDVRAPGRLSSRGITKDTVTITTMGGDIEVDDAPAGAAVHTMGGDIEVYNAEKFVKAKTMGGDIEIEIGDGWVRATTMAGDIDVSVLEGLGEGDKGVELESYSGDITLQIPSGLGLELDLTIAYTKNSRKNYRIECDWDLDIEVSKEWDYDNGTPRKRIHGTGVVGDGKIPITIETINGNIYVEEVD